MKHAIAVLTLALTLIALTGCPALGVPDPTLPDSNTLIVHNNSGKPIFFLSAVRVPDECSMQKPDGVNLIPADLEDGKMFSVKNLSDGRYYCYAGNQKRNDGSVVYPIEGYVTLIGGTSVDWYVTAPTS